METGSTSFDLPSSSSDALDTAPISRCFPRRAIGHSRRLWTLNAGILTGACLLFFMVIPGRESVFVPGELSHKHAQILENTVVADRCSLCHATTHWTILPTGGKATQDALCLRCHENHLVDARLRSPHDIPSENVRALSQQRQDRLIASGKPVSVKTIRDHGLENATSCSACHVEHHGREFDLKHMDNDRCQACHQQQFSSLAIGHPEFEDFPNQTSRKLAFDHRAHESTHFTKTNQDFDCRVCHLDFSREGVGGPIFRTLGFDVACARCHKESIQAAIASGWAVIQLPSVEQADTKDAALGFSDWPTNARFGYDGSVSPVMRTLLEADDSFRELLNELPSSGKLSDVPAFERLQARMARGLAQATRNFIQETAKLGQSAWQQRLHKVMRQRLSREPSKDELQLISAACAGLPPDLFRHIQNSWFGTGDSLSSNRLRTGAYPLALLGTPQHRARFRLAGDESLLLDTQIHQNLSNGSVQLDRSDDSLRTEDETNTADSLLGLNDDLVQQKQAMLPKLRGSTHVAEGGWYLDQDTLSVSYMPRGHADPMLTAWTQLLQILNFAPHTQTDHHAQKFPHGVGDNYLKQVPGKCFECHVLVDQHASIQLGASPWRSAAKPAGIRTFTKFDHRPHLTLSSVNDCRYCHQFARETDPTKLVSTGGESITQNMSRQHDSSTQEFTPMKREQCSACHRPGGANDGCIQCHNYHVGTRGLQWSSPTTTW